MKILDMRTFVIFCDLFIMMFFAAVCAVYCAGREYAFGAVYRALALLQIKHIRQDIADRLRKRR
ncbi:MAG: hypothetical protein PUB11_01095 [Oscillospiraceae bacterium]|nr:hypothetical protein [Oscillospiraceae bacterium]